VTRLQGDVQIGRKDSAGTLFRITVPLTVSTHRLLLVSLDDRTYAIPVHAVERVLRIPVTECETIEGKPVVTLHDRPIALVDLGELLEAPRSRTDDEGEMLRVVVIKAGSRRMAVRVDGFLSERDLLMQDLDVYAASNRYLGAVLPEDGVAALVLNPAELLDGARPGARRTVVEQVRTRRAKATPRVLVVDDSFTTRTLEKSILEANGFQVGIAVDGREGLSQLQRERFDLVISDVEMPRMDGFALLAAIKQDERLSSTPVVLVTSRDRREDREKGLDLGADAYIVKQKFDHQSWLSTIREIVGA
jgi:two-component system chemotaxis sensor kinase CheA